MQMLDAPIKQPTNRPEMMARRVSSEYEFCMRFLS
jgi:hypothetical protein